MTNLNWGSRSSVRYGGVSVPWCGALSACPASSLGVQKIRAPLRAASMTISFERTVWHASTIFCKNPINGSFEFLGVPDLLSSNRPSIPDWGVGVTVTNLNWGSRSSVRYGGVSVPWCGALSACPASSLGVQKIRAPLRAASMTISFERTVWHASKFYLIPPASSVIVWSIGRVAPGVIFGMSRLRINLCEEFLLVVSGSVIFLSFLSLV